MRFPMSVFKTLMGEKIPGIRMLCGEHPFDEEIILFFCLTRILSTAQVMHFLGNPWTRKFIPCRMFFAQLWWWFRCYHSHGNQKFA